MQRIKYAGQEYLVPTRSGQRVIDVLQAKGVEIGCPGGSACAGKCAVDFPKDGLWLLWVPSEVERKVLGEEKLAKGTRLACQAIFR